MQLPVVASQQLTLLVIKHKFEFEPLTLLPDDTQASVQINHNPLFGEQLVPVGDRVNEAN